MIHSLESRRDGNLPRRNGIFGLIDSGNSSGMVGADVGDTASQVETAAQIKRVREPISRQLDQPRRPADMIADSAP